MVYETNVSHWIFFKDLQLFEFPVTCVFVIETCLEWSIAHGPSIGLQGLMRPAQTLPLLSHTENCICKPWMVLTKSRKKYEHHQYGGDPCDLLIVVTSWKGFASWQNALSLSMDECVSRLTILQIFVDHARSYSLLPKSIVIPQLPKSRNQIHYILHPWKLTFPLKRHNSNRKFHLPTINFQRIYSMSGGPRCLFLPTPIHQKHLNGFFHQKVWNHSSPPALRCTQTLPQQSPVPWDDFQPARPGWTSGRFERSPIPAEIFTFFGAFFGATTSTTVKHFHSESQQETISYLIIFYENAPRTGNKTKLSDPWPSFFWWPLVQWMICCSTSSRPCS